MKLIENIRNKHELTRSVKVADVKMYLQEEYKRAFKREELITKQEKEISELKKVEMKYEALLVVQDNTQKRIEKQDERIDELKKTIKEYEDQIKLEKSKSFNIERNATTKIEELRKELKTKDKEIKKLQKK